VRAYLFCLEYLAEERHVPPAANTNYDKLVNGDSCAPAIIRPSREFPLISQAGH